MYKGYSVTALLQFPIPQDLRSRSLLLSTQTTHICMTLLTVSQTYISKHDGITLRHPPKSLYRREQLPAARLLNFDLLLHISFFTAPQLVHGGHNV